MATPMSKLTRALTLAAMLATVSLTSMIAVAQAHTSNVPASTRHRALGRVEFHATGDHPASSQQETAADATVRRLLTRERFTVPTTGPAHPRLLLDEERSSLLNLPSAAPPQAPSTVRPAGHGGRAGWLAPALGALALVLALITVVAVLVARRTSRVQRAGQTA